MHLNILTAKREQNAQEVVEYIWNTKYRYETDTSLADTKKRVARAAAKPEKEPYKWEEVFINLLDYFLPGGRVLSSLGTSRSKTTAMNCFVSQEIEDSMDGIFGSIHKAALIMQAGGGVGFDWSTLRPYDSHVLGVGSKASGPVSFMKVADVMCETIASVGHRRGAMMAVLRVDHPDIERFVTAKRGVENEALTNFNLSVAITDPFIEAIKENKNWTLTFKGQSSKTLPARELWDIILSQAYDYAEPGIIFIDRVNRMNNLYYCETISCTNPCGEQPLPPNGVCNLGSINLVKFVTKPFIDPSFNYDLFANVIRDAVRFLDNVNDVANLPLNEHFTEVKNKRRIGLGITGLADALWMLGFEYGSSETVEFCRGLARFMRDTAYAASVELAKEKGSFPLFDVKKYLSGNFVRNLPENIRIGIAEHGIRNSHLLTIAPTGTTSLLWGNISSGVEPILALSAERKIKEPGGMEKTVVIDDYAYRIWKSVYGEDGEPTVLTADKISAKGHIDMMAAFQEFFDASISKTINFDANTSFDEFKDTYMYAFDKGLKGLTVYRPSEKIGAVIKKKDPYEYNKPVLLPEERIKHAIKVEIPDEGFYEVEITVYENRPREVWLHAPVEQKYGALLQAIVRLTSIALRCNIDPKVILKQLKEANLEYGNVSSPLGFIERALLKVMSKYGVQPVLIGLNICPQCGSAVVVEEGCVHCISCTFTRCS